MSDSSTSFVIMSSIFCHNSVTISKPLKHNIISSRHCGTKYCIALSLPTKKPLRKKHHHIQFNILKDNCYHEEHT